MTTRSPNGPYISVQSGTYSFSKVRHLCQRVYVLRPVTSTTSSIAVFAPGSRYILYSWSWFCSSTMQLHETVNNQNDTRSWSGFSCFFIYIFVCPCFYLDASFSLPAIIFSRLVVTQFRDQNSRVSSPPLPTTDRAIIFIARRLQSFFPRRLASNLFHGQSYSDLIIPSYSSIYVPLGI